MNFLKLFADIYYQIILSNNISATKLNSLSFSYIFSSDVDIHKFLLQNNNSINKKEDHIFLFTANYRSQKEIAINKDKINKYIKNAIDYDSKLILIDSNYVDYIDGNNFDKSKKYIILSIDNLCEIRYKILQRIYNNLPKNILTVTGTNGKTSVSSYILQLAKIIDIDFATIGTTGILLNNDIKLSEYIVISSLTTPDICNLYHNLFYLKSIYNINNVIIEASSIAIEQNRIKSLDISLAAFTNFTRDHLDYHKIMDNYFNAKLKLFSLLSNKKLAILNHDILQYNDIKKYCLKFNNQIYSYGKNINADLYIKNVKDDIITISIFDKIYEFNFNFASEFEIYNILCSLLMVITYFDLKDNDKIVSKILANINKIKNPEGRIELITKLENNSLIYIDYAHTEDAIENILMSLKNKYKNYYIKILFGCGGDRDNSKREIMGKIASELADFVIITDDNPRNENPHKIRKDIMKLINNNNYIEIENRYKAIKYAISNLKSDEILLIAGKGHEKYQIIGSKKYEFDEKKIIFDLLKNGKK